MAYTFDRNLFSDLHKEAFGHRPFPGKLHWLANATDDELQEEWDFLLRAAHLRAEEDRRIEQENLALWNATIDRLAEVCGSREEAIRWDMAAHDHENDPNFYCWEYGIPYGTILK